MDPPSCELFQGVLKSESSLGRPFGGGRGVKRISACSIGVFGPQHPMLIKMQQKPYVEFQNPKTTFENTPFVHPNIA